MVKGHNKRGESNDPDSLEKAKGQDRHKTKKERQRESVKGRQADEDPSHGRKKENNV